MAALIFIGFVTLIVAGFVTWIIYDKFPKVVVVSVCVVIIAIGAGIMYVYSNTASYQRDMHDMKSQFSNGVYRELKVYAVTGELITSTKGTFDVEYADGRVKYIDEKGLSHLIYAGSGATVMVDDIEQPETSK